MLLQVFVWPEDVLEFVAPAGHNFGDLPDRQVQLITDQCEDPDTQMHISNRKVLLWNPKRNRNLMIHTVARSLQCFMRKNSKTARTTLTPDLIDIQYITETEQIHA